MSQECGYEKGAEVHVSCKHKGYCPPLMEKLEAQTDKNWTITQVPKSMSINGEGLIVNIKAKNDEEVEKLYKLITSEKCIIDANLYKILDA